MVAYAFAAPSVRHWSRLLCLLCSVAYSIHVTPSGTEGVGIGTAIVSYIEPHAGAARDFNRWYERDHFPAAVMAGPGAYSGARFVATRACKAARLGDGLFGDRQRGSYLSLAWLLPGAQAAWDAWIPGQMETLLSEDRMFAGRDHLHTAVYQERWGRQAPDAPPVALALDHGYPGVIAIAFAGEGEQREVDIAIGSRALVGADVPVLVGLSRERLLASVLDVPAHVLLLAFVVGDVLDVWRRVVEPAVTGVAGVGFAGPFLATIPGTDTYTDDL